MRVSLLVLALGLASLWQPVQAAPATLSVAAIKASATLIEVRSSSGRPRTQSVRSYTRRDGRHVSAYRRAPSHR
jgi:hypothetical protein